MFHLDSSSVVDCLHDRRSGGGSPSSFPSLPTYEKAGLRDPVLGNSRNATVKPFREKVLSVTIRCSEEKEEEKNDGVLTTVATRPPTYSRKAAPAAPSSIALGKTLGLDTTNQEITISYMGRKYSVSDGDLSMKEASSTTPSGGWISQRLSKKGPLRKRLRDKFSFRTAAASETVPEKQEDDFQSDFLSHKDDISELSEGGSSSTAPRSRHTTYGEPLSCIFAEPEEKSDETTADTYTNNHSEELLLESFPKNAGIATCDESVEEEEKHEQDDDGEHDPLSVDAQLFDEVYSIVSKKLSTTTITTSDDSNKNPEPRRFGHRLRRRRNQSQQPQESKPDVLISSEIENVSKSGVSVVGTRQLDAGLGRSVSFEGPKQSDERGLRKIFRGR